MTARTVGTNNTPAINSRIDLPFEILAINKPTNGDQDICQAQKNIVFAPNHSLSIKGVIVKDISTILATYPPKVVTILSNNVTDEGDGLLYNFSHLI